MNANDGSRPFYGFLIYGYEPSSTDPASQPSKISPYLSKKMFTERGNRLQEGTLCSVDIGHTFRLVPQCLHARSPVSHDPLQSHHPQHHPLSRIIQELHIINYHDTQQAPPVPITAREAPVFLTSNEADLDRLSQ